VRCGLCLHGCPYDLIYSSAQTLARLEGHPHFRYADGLYVRRFVETGHGVEVHAVRATTGGRPLRGRASSSAPACSRARDSPSSRSSASATRRRCSRASTFLIPCSTGGAFANAPEERLQTLSQLWPPLDDPAVSAHAVHVLLYTYSRSIARRCGVAGALRPVSRARVARTAADAAGLPAFGRLGTHGAEPARQRRPSRDARGPRPPHAETVPTIRRVEARIRAIGGSLHASPIPFMTRIAKPGKSYHSGGTFPMQRDPGRCRVISSVARWGSRASISSSQRLPTIPPPT